MGWVERGKVGGGGALLSASLKLSISECTGFLSSLLPCMPQYKAVVCTLTILHCHLQAEM